MWNIPGHASCVHFAGDKATAFADWWNLQHWCPWNIFLSGWFHTNSSCSHRHPCCAQRWGFFLLLPKPGNRTSQLQLSWPVVPTTTTSDVEKEGGTIPRPHPQHQEICFWPVFTLSSRGVAEMSFATLTCKLQVQCRENSITLGCWQEVFLCWWKLHTISASVLGLGRLGLFPLKKTQNQMLPIIQPFIQKRPWKQPKMFPLKWRNTLWSEKTLPPLHCVSQLPPSS